LTTEAKGEPESSNGESTTKSSSLLSSSNVVDGEGLSSGPDDELPEGFECEETNSWPMLKLSPTQTSFQSVQFFFCFFFFFFFFFTLFLFDMEG
jgi:hypothetical protein